VLINFFGTIQISLLNLETGAQQSLRHMMM